MTEQTRLEEKGCLSCLTYDLCSTITRALETEDYDNYTFRCPMATA